MPVTHASGLSTDAKFSNWISSTSVACGKLLELNGRNIKYWIICETFLRGHFKTPALPNYCRTTRFGKVPHVGEDTCFLGIATPPIPRGRSPSADQFMGFSWNRVYSLRCRATKFSQVACTVRCVFYGVSHAFVYCTGVL